MNPLNLAATAILFTAIWQHNLEAIALVAMASVIARLTARAMIARK